LGVFPSISNTSESDLWALVAAAATEDRTLEFKSEPYAAEGDGNREFSRMFAP